MFASALFWMFPASAGTVCTPAAEAAGLVINEILPDPRGPDEGLEWIELYNGGTAAAVLDGYVIAAGTSQLVAGHPLPPGITLAAGGYLVIGQQPAAGIDVVAVGPTLGNAGSNADAVQLRDCDHAVLDTVVYGSPNVDGWIDDRGGVAVSLAPAPPSGASLGRIPDGIDTDASGDDFVVFDVPTLGLSNDATAEECGGPGSGIVVNEIFPNPPGADGGFEWVELFHGGDAAIDVTDWSVEVATSSWTEVTVLEGVMSPGERLLIGGERVQAADIVASFGLGNATSSSDAVRIVDCGGVPSDTLVYGGPNDGETPFVDDTGGVAVRLASVPGEGASLQRISDGYDTDDNSVDWAVTDEPTPGGPNPEVAPVECVPSTGDVVINEILPDPTGEDAGFEFVELMNRSSAPIRLDGWSLVVATRSFDTADVTVGGGVAIPAGGFFVVGGAEVPQADLEAVFSLGNGTGTDGVRLVDCDGTAVDTVLYGESGNEDQIPDDAESVVEPYGDPGAGQSLARLTDGADRDAAEDWGVKGRPTPGQGNQDVLSGGEDPIEDPFARRGGCLGPSDPPTGPPELATGCRHNPTFPAGWVVALLLATCWRARGRQQAEGAPS